VPTAIGFAPACTVSVTLVIWSVSTVNAPHPELLKVPCPESQPTASAVPSLVTAMASPTRTLLNPMPPSKVSAPWPYTVSIDAPISGAASVRASR